MVPVISFIGYHNSGKTTIATKVVKILVEKGYRVAVLKSTKHRKLIGDTPGKDSYRYRESGAEAVGIVSPDEIVLFQDIDRDNLRIEFLSFLLFGDYDIVICEGFKHANVPKIEVTRKELAQPLLFKEVNNVIAVVSDFPVEGIRQFSFKDVEKLTSLIEEEFLKKSRRNLDFFVNGKKLELDEKSKKLLKELLMQIACPADKSMVRIDVRLSETGKNS